VRRIKEIEREDFKKKKFELINQPYHDYFKEGMKQAASKKDTQSRENTPLKHFESP
jgi:hypothetical protein